MHTDQHVQFGAVELVGCDANHCVWYRCTLVALRWMRKALSLSDAWVVE